MGWGISGHAYRICTNCQKSANDDPGAYFGHGILCPTCGCYRTVDTIFWKAEIKDEPKEQVQEKDEPSQDSLEEDEPYF